MLDKVKITIVDTSITLSDQINTALGYAENILEVSNLKNRSLNKVIETDSIDILIFGGNTTNFNDAKSINVLVHTIQDLQDDFPFIKVIVFLDEFDMNELQVLFNLNLNGYFDINEKDFDKALRDCVDSTIHNQTYLSESIRRKNPKIETPLIHSESIPEENNVLHSNNRIPEVYKLSIGLFSPSDISQFLLKNIAVLHNKTKPKGRSKTSQADLFKGAEIGDVFYLCSASRDIYLVGKFISDWEDCELIHLRNEGFIQRKYEVILKPKSENIKLGNSKKWWMPNNFSTFIKIPQSDYSLANDQIFIPNFQHSIKNIIDLSQNLDLSEFFNTIYGNVTPTIDRNVNPILDVEILSGQFSKLLLQLNENTGQMVGVFGSWGRGKTFFIEQVCKKLGIDFRTEKNLQNSKFYFTKFHAWKYQDSESVWAYLYETIAKSYYGHRDKIEWEYPLIKSNWLKKIIRWTRNKIIIPLLRFKNEVFLTFRVNIAKYGTRQLYSFLMLVILYSIVTWLSTTNVYRKLSSEVVEIIKNSIEIFGILWVVILLYRLWLLGRKGKRIVNLYTGKQRFNKVLGLQSEIQEELKFLLKAWMKSEYIPIEKDKGEIAFKEVLKNDKKLLLFVDDIDRCQEEKMIQVIDALRVMLEDEFIAKRIIIVTAIDEEILERAILWKYKDIFNSNGINTDLKSLSKSPRELVKEYMDKLFISGIKLVKLNLIERERILINYINNANLMPSKGKVTLNKIVESVGELDMLPKELKGNLIDNLSSLEESKEKLEDSISNLIRGSDEHQENKDLIQESELNLLKEKIKDFPSLTPRQIRILLYRYLLAKGIAQDYSSYNLNTEWSRLLIESIIDKSIDLNKQINIRENKQEKIDLKTAQFIQKIIQVVVPY